MIFFLFISSLPTYLSVHLPSVFFFKQLFLEIHNSYNKIIFDHKFYKPKKLFVLPRKNNIARHPQTIYLPPIYIPMYLATFLPIYLSTYLPIVEVPSARFWGISSVQNMSSTN